MCNKHYTNCKGVLLQVNAFLITITLRQVHRKLRLSMGLSKFTKSQSGGYVYDQPSRINCSIRLDASQRSRDGVWVNRSARVENCKELAFTFFYKVCWVMHCTVADLCLSPLTNRVRDEVLSGAKFLPNPCPLPTRSSGQVTTACMLPTTLPFLMTRTMSMHY